jgi:hypothetical protein
MIAYFKPIDRQGNLLLRDICTENQGRNSAIYVTSVMSAIERATPA